MAGAGRRRQATTTTGHISTVGPSRSSVESSAAAVATTVTGTDTAVYACRTHIGAVAGLYHAHRPTNTATTPTAAISRRWGTNGAAAIITSPPGPDIKAVTAASSRLPAGLPMAGNPG